MSGGALGLEAPAVETEPSKLPLFSENPRRLILGNWASESKHSRKFSFVLCSVLRTAGTLCYTGLYSSSVCSAGFLEEFFSETISTPDTVGLSDKRGRLILPPRSAQPLRVDLLQEQGGDEQQDADRRNVPNEGANHRHPGSIEQHVRQAGPEVKLRTQAGERAVCI